MLAAKTREDFVSAVRALDRVLMSGAYVLPLFHLPGQWLAHWHQLRHPEVTPLYGAQIDWEATRPISRSQRLIREVA
jgi:peptide/nickel transport system substrate-binding protein